LKSRGEKDRKKSDNHHFLITSFPPLDAARCDSNSLKCQKDEEIKARRYGALQAQFILAERLFLEAKAPGSSLHM